MSRRMKRIGACLLAACVFCSTTELRAAERKGTEIECDMRNGGRIRGELLQVHEGNLRILNRTTDSPFLVSLSDVRSLKLVKKSKVLAGTGAGLLGGALVGAGIGALSDSGGWFSGGELVVMGAVFFGIVGAGLGGLAGAITGVDERVSCEGRTPKELAGILAKLQRHAKYAAAETTPVMTSLVRGQDAPATHLAEVPSVSSDPIADAAAAGPVAPTNAVADRLRRLHVGFGVHYATSAGVGALEKVMRSVGFDHQERVCFFGCASIDYPQVWRSTRMLTDVRIDYSLNSKWAVGFAYSPIGVHRVAGREEIANVDYRPTYQPDTELAAEYGGQTLALTASLFPVPDAFLQKDTVRASFGVGVGRVRTSLMGGPSAGLDSSNGPADHLEGQTSQTTVPAIVASADWIHFFGKSLSLNLGVQYRYIPFTLGPQTLAAPYWYYPASPSLDGTLTWGAASVALPRQGVNAGGLGFGLGFGLHF